MVIVMREDATEDQLQAVVNHFTNRGARAYFAQDDGQVLIGIVGLPSTAEPVLSTDFTGAADIRAVPSPFKLSSRAYHPQPTVVRVGSCEIGNGSPVFIAGPCSVESRSQLLELAFALRSAGAHLIRGGAFKPRSSPYSFQGLGETGLQYLAEAREQTGLGVVSEIMDPGHMDMARDYIDVIQIGARNMQNYPLLRAAGRTGLPVLLKRGLSATIEEWLLAAEYILSEGNPNVILCERGIRTFERYTRNTLDLNAVPVVKHISHLPILVDPSHGIGIARYVPPMSMAALAAGADGLLLEVHACPESAWSDGQQTLTPEQFAKVVQRAQSLEGWK